MRSDGCLVRACITVLCITAACAHLVPTVVAQLVAVIAVLYSGSGPPEYAAIGQETRATAALWLEHLQPHLAAAGGIGDTDIVPRLVYCDERASASRTVECLRNLTAAYTLSAILAPENELIEAIAPLTDA